MRNLGVSFLARFELARNRVDLEHAIPLLGWAIELAPSDDPDLAGQLVGLSGCLLISFDLTADIPELNAAIAGLERAMELMPAGDSGQIQICCSLGSALTRRFKLVGDPADLDAAIALNRLAAGLLPSGHPAFAGCLSDLSLALVARFNLAGDDADLDAAINASRLATEFMPASHDQLAVCLCNLGLALRTRFETTGSRSDLDAAIDAHRRAVDRTAVDDPQRAMYLSNLGTALHDRFQVAGDCADFDAAIDYGRQASQMTAALPWIRLTAATGWASASADANRMAQAADGFAVAVGQLSAAAGYGLARESLEQQLARWLGLAADGAACAIGADRPEQAVELLEQGRSVIWTQALHLRGDFTKLAERAPDLASRLEHVRAVLVRSQDAVELRRRAAGEWDDALAQVRLLDGFEHFLATVPYSTLRGDLKAAALDGSVVMINSSRHGCHALIVDADSDRPRVVNLEKLTLKTAKNRVNEFLMALDGCADPGRPIWDREQDRRTVVRVLGWLWDVMAEPILTALGCTGIPGPGDSWPRVWWCLTGPLAVLPIHAAGRHLRRNGTDDGSTDCVIDRVISSYTPTLAALTRTRRPGRAAPARLLAVGLPDTPGLPGLPGASAELEVVASRFPPESGSLTVTGPQATRAAVLTAIEAHSWLHLACHARQEHAEPASSGFALWDGTLTITDLAAQPTSQFELAFLSACKTMAGSLRHLDEAIHPAAAMQFVGYRQVVATMWAIADLPARRVADAFYAGLVRNGHLDADLAAESLHHAIRKLRAARSGNPVIWAPYIHLGK